MTSIEKRVHKPGSSTYQINLKSIDHYGNESAVVSQTNVRGVPPDPTSAPTITIDKGGRKKRRITATGTYAGAHTDDDVTTVAIKATIDGKTTWPKADLAADGTFSHVFRGLDKGDAYNISYRVVDDDGKRSGFSPSATGTITGKKPGKVTGKQVVTKTRAVVVKYTAPTVWSDATAMDPEDIDHFKIVLKNNGGSTVETDNLHKGLYKTFHFTKAEMNALNTPLHADVTAIGVDGEDDGVDGIASSATPTEIAISDLTGSITYAQSGTLGVSRYGTTTTMNAASAKEGDIWLNTSYSPVRIYRYLSGAWAAHTLDTTLLAGTVIANSVVAGAIDGHDINGVNITGSVISGATITGGTFRTATSGARVALSESVPGLATFYTSGGDAVVVGAAYSGSATAFDVIGHIRVQGDIEIDGALNHDGTTYGLCGATPSTRETINNLAAGADLAAVRTRCNTITDALRTKGLIN